MLQSPCGRWKGTLGGWFSRDYNASEKRKFIGLTSRHLFDLSKKSKNLIKTQVYTSSGTRIGSIESTTDLVPWSPSKRIVNKVDLALIRPCRDIATEEIEAACTIVCLKGETDAEINFSHGNTKVLVCCERCCHPREIIGISSVVYTEFNGIRYRFDEVIKISTANSGESGSLLMDTSENVCGQIFATKELTREGYAIKWDQIKNVSGIPFIIT